MSIDDLAGQGWLQLGELALAFVLSALIGLEREIRHKSAGLRTYTLVGFSAALIMLISKYGFMNILATNRVVLDPSRIAAQIVTGIGFILGFPYIAVRLPKSRWTPSLLQVSYQDGREILREVLLICTKYHFAVSRLQVEREPALAEPEDITPPPNVADELSAGDPDSHNKADPVARTSHSYAERIVTVVLEVQGVGSVSKLAEKLSTIDGIVSVNAGDVNVLTD